MTKAVVRAYYASFGEREWQRPMRNTSIKHAL